MAKTIVHEAAASSYPTRSKEDMAATTTKTPSQAKATQVDEQNPAHSSTYKNSEPLTKRRLDENPSFPHQAKTPSKLRDVWDIDQMFPDPIHPPPLPPRHVLLTSFGSDADLSLYGPAEENSREAFEREQKKQKTCRDTSKEDENILKRYPRNNDSSSRGGEKKEESIQAGMGSLRRPLIMDWIDDDSDSSSDDDVWK